MIVIETPIWNVSYFVKGYKGRGVGINMNLIQGDKTQFEISYEDSFKRRLYPNAFEFDNSLLEKMPRKHHKGVTLVYIPLSECTIAKETLSPGSEVKSSEASDAIL